MARLKQEPVDPADLPPPEVIARQIEADLKTALRHIAAVAKSLEGPQRPIEDVQLAIDL
jgi:hypothetical protein